MSKWKSPYPEIRPFKKQSKEKEFADFRHSWIFKPIKQMLIPEKEN